MQCWTRRQFNVIENLFRKYFKYFISFLLISFSCLFIWPASVDSTLEFFESTQGVQIQRSLESLRDLDNQSWQLVVYPKEENQDKFVLRIVGFTGSLRLDHPTKLIVESGLKTWNLEDITLDNAQLANDSRDAAVEFLLNPLLKDLQNNRPLRLSLKGGFSELPVPPYVVKEWRSMDPISYKNEN